MMNLKRSFALLASVFILNSAVAQQQRMVDFVGGARSIMTNNQLMVHDSLADTSTVKRNTGGYALIDLGVNIRPNSTTEILGTFRIRNNYGGFWGAGVTVDVRELWLKGIIGNIVRYQVGDLNLKQTPFTFYNHHADRFDSLPSVFALQNDIVGYEKFYSNNTWRQQGANVDFGFTFSKWIEEINFSAYTTRLNASNFSTIPDRLFSGATVNIVQSKHFEINYNVASVFDVKGTASASNNFHNNVNTVNTSYGSSIGALDWKISGEAGQSDYAYSEAPDESDLSDYFIYAKGEINWKAKHLSINGGYLNVGPDFRSIGAQSKDVNYSALTNYYERYTNSQSLRPYSLYDLLSNDAIYNTGISTSTAGIDASINNVMPYGIATFNRVGGFAGLNYSNPKGYYLTATHFMLNEIRGQGTTALKDFNSTEINACVEVNKLLNFKKTIKVQGGVTYMTTARSGNITLEDVDLKTNKYQVGAEVEVSKGLDLLFGIVSLDTKGNEFIAERNQYTVADYFNKVDYKLNELITAYGVRYRFDSKIYICGLFQHTKYTDDMHTNVNYAVDQFSLIYNMTF
jgi:hypothetical protein